ncbi:MAG: exonuclease SbcCD subunit D C-terminal domain-containing protein [Acidobacteriota bacterium]
MLILHTADWHLGQRFHDQRRLDDERHALEHIVRIARERRVDAVLVAGDVFDHPNPGAEEQRLYYRTLARLVDEAGVATVVVTAGNHDSALRIEGPRALLCALHIHVVGRWGRSAPADRPLVPLRRRDGEVAALCLAVPYLRDADLRLPALGEGAREMHRRYAAALEGRYVAGRGAARGAYPETPLVVMGHCYVTSALLGGGERPVQVGNLAQVEAGVLAGDAAYLALGHLHRPQDIAGHRHWRYSGSLLPTGFDEVGTRREVTLFRIDGPGLAADIESIPLEPYRDYRRLEGDPAGVRAQVDALPLHGVDGPTPWCEATLDLTRPEPGLARELIDRCRDRGWNLVSVRRRAQPTPAPEAFDARTELRELDPEDVFARRHEAEFGEPPDEELRLEFARLLEDVLADENAEPAP